VTGYTNVDELRGYDWFEQCERREAEEKLRGLATGTYLVRFSPGQNRYAISLR